jgi:cell division protein FtsW (lipid II flippase)
MKNETFLENRRLAMPAAVFFAFAFLLLGLQNGNVTSFVLAILVPVFFFIASVILPRVIPTDILILSMVNFLCCLGILIIYRVNPQRGIDQVFNYLVGLLGMIGCLLVVRFWHRLKWLIPFIMVGALVLMALPLLIGSVRNGAKAWVSVFGVSFQPSEIVKVALLLILSALLSRRLVLPALIFSFACFGMLFLQRDLGTAMIYYAVVLILVFSATGSITFLALATLGAIGGATVGYQMNTYVQNRVKIWLNPWEDPYGISYQVVQSLVAMVNGGPWGTGLGLGEATSIPYIETDFIFAAIYNEFGLIFGCGIILIYLALFLRGVRIAKQAQSKFHTLLALGCSCLIAVQTFVIIGGNINFIPLTGVTLPFISYGGTSMVSSLCVAGLLQGVANANERGMLEDQMIAMLGEERA